MDTPIRALLMNHNLVVQLEIVDPAGAPAGGRFSLDPGANRFSCVATYIDGSRRPYAAYWTCPMLLRGGGLDVWGVHGRQRQEGVTVHASPKQERYTELACWVFEPQPDRRNEFPRASIGFDYSLIDKSS